MYKIINKSIFIFTTISKINFLLQYIIKIPSAFKAQSKPAQAGTTVDLDMQITDLSRRENEYKMKADQARAMAKKYVQMNNKNMAMTYLRQAKNYEQSQQRIANQICTYTQLQMNMQTINDAKNHAKIMQDQKLDMDNVEKVVSEVQDATYQQQEQQAQINQIDEMLNQANAMNDLEGEQDLNSEFQQLQLEAATQQADQQSLPSVPQQQIQQPAVQNGNVDDLL